MKTNLMRMQTSLLMIMVTFIFVSASRCPASVEPELTMAIRQKNLPQVQRLLSQGANVNEADEAEEQTPLMWAVQVRDSHLMQMLLAHGASLNTQDGVGKTALLLAVEKGYAELAGALLAKGADPDVRNAEGTTARRLAQERGDALLLKRMARRRKASPQQQARKPVSDHAVTRR